MAPFASEKFISMLSRGGKTQKGHCQAFLSFPFFLSAHLLWLSPVSLPVYLIPSFLPPSFLPCFPDQSIHRNAFRDKALEV
mmetsp:Transcript_3926/g.8073  ORF Transcript_3926/g.8073 Transcript_3926/m.8073 type:complete len:81 (-) Transcript_3926:323-565(-)